MERKQRLERGERLAPGRAQGGRKEHHHPVPIPEVHANKYFSYSEAWVRIKKAQGYGFYLEAVTLEESIIADRLLSFLVCVGEIQADSQIEKYGFAQLIQRWTKRVPEPIPTKYFPNLRSAIDEWRKRRNRVVHGMVKSVPGFVHNDVLDFLKEAKLIALQGQALARAISDWVRKAKRQFDGTKGRSVE